MERARKASRRVMLYLGTLAKWAVISGVIGSLCGLIGTAFHIGVDEGTQLRQELPWLLWCLPVAGVAIVALYRVCGTERLGTNDIIDAVHQGKKLPVLLLPAIFIATVLTHLCGGSAGREGAALQMGGTVGQTVGRGLRLDERDLRVATLAGMAAFFSALFGTPVAATVFALMVISVGVLYHVALVPSLVAAVVAYGVSVQLGVEPTHFHLATPVVGPVLLLRVAALGALCAVVSILFCRVIHGMERGMAQVKNAYVRVILGGGIIIALTYLTGSGDYNGAGMDVITAAVEQGQVRPEAFLWKLLFTAVTLAAGFKGGEVVPSFFVGATFGCAVGPLIGLPAGFSAALGLTAVFCGVTNCPVASTLLSVELFGSEGLLCFALVCGVSYVLSGYSGLYSSQTILYSKLKAFYINVRTNAHHAGDDPCGGLGSWPDQEKENRPRHQ